MRYYLLSCQKPFKKSYLFLDAFKSDKFGGGASIGSIATHEVF